MLHSGVVRNDLSVHDRSWISRHYAPAPESVTICPYLARDWNISVKRLAVGERLLYFKLKWDGTDVVATVRNEGNVIDVDFGIVVPVIADCLSATIQRRQS